MIIGTITLITLLFFGSFQDTFLIPGLEKSIKEYVLNDERKSDILAELKMAEKEIDQFQKIAKKDMRSLQEYNLGQDAILEQFQAFYKKRSAARQNITTLAIERRLRIQDLITDDEWAPILLNGEEQVKELNEKHLKKEAKGNADDVMENIRITIGDVVENTVNRDEAMSAFEEFRTVYQEMDRTIKEQRSMRSDIIRNRTSSKDEFQTIAHEQIELRKRAYDELVKFHFKMLQVLNENEWLPVMKSFNRILG